MNGEQNDDGSWFALSHLDCVSRVDTIVSFVVDFSTEWFDHSVGISNFITFTTLFVKYQ